MEADLKVKKPTAPLKDTKQNRIGSPDLTLRNKTRGAKFLPVPKFHAVVARSGKGAKILSDRLRCPSEESPRGLAVQPFRVCSLR